MRKGVKVARVPAYWFGWCDQSHRLGWYVRVYWECRRLGIRKSDKEKVTAVMRRLAHVTHL